MKQDNYMSKGTMNEAEQKAWNDAIFNTGKSPEIMSTNEKMSKKEDAEANTI